MRIVFLGQSCAAASPPLAALLAAGHEVSSAILARRAGARLGETQRAAQEAGAPVVWVRSTAEAAAALRAAAPDLAVAACFPWRLPASVLAVPSLGILNVHPSLLPAGRGAEPLFWTLRRGERITGVTVHRMDASLDTGPIAAQAELPVAAGVRAPDLERELMTLGGRLLVDVLPAVEAGTLRPRDQPEEGVSHSPVPTAADWTISPLLPAAWAWGFARGVAPLRGPLTVLAGGQPIPVLDALDWSAEERLGARVMDEGDGVVQVRFAPGWVRFRKKS